MLSDTRNQLRRLQTISFYCLAAYLLLIACNSLSQAEPLKPTSQKATVSSLVFQRYDQSLLSQVVTDQLNRTYQPADQRQDLAFHYLWLQQHREDYSHKDGGAALGKILRLSLRALYNNHYGRKASSSEQSSDYSYSESHMNYRLRVSSDRVRLGVKYEF
ncbi:MAG: hypothetical protein ACJAYG_001690 [Oceanicoccus sp.]|jgi:hypothetical protein